MGKAIAQQSGGTPNLSSLTLKFNELKKSSIAYSNIMGGSSNISKVLLRRLGDFLPRQGTFKDFVCYNSRFAHFFAEKKNLKLI